DHWNEAMNEEVTALHQLDVFDEVPEESWIKIISSKWVYNIKWKPEGPIDRFKARLVARGFTQMFGVDFWDTFAPTVMATSIRTFLTVCKIKGLLVHQVDVKTAFLNGDIDGEIYVRPPEPYYVPGKVWKLKKALYGLKQSPRCWSQKLNEIMAHLGFQPLKADRCIFTRRDGGELSYILVFVDDMLVAAKDAKVLEQIKGQLKSQLDIKDLGPIGTFLGVDCKSTQDGKCLMMSQERYIEELTKRFNLTPSQSRNCHKSRPLISRLR